MAKDKEKSEGQKLQDELSFSFKHIGQIRPEDIEPSIEFCEGYKTFMNSSKTERECVRTLEAMAKKEGYRLFDPKASYKSGDRFYYVNRKKNVMLVTVGKKPLDDGIKFNIAHIDSPRLDLKPNPLYENTEISYFKTHYYGGIRKYQWGTTPLAMHGVVVLKDGNRVDISIGENDDEPKFVVSDLLPHLSAQQNKRPLSDGLKGEELNIIVGNIPYQDDDVTEPYKLMTLKLLHDKYGMTEKDFTRAEIEMVPAVKAADIGLDRSLVGAYGQDDKVCAYAAVMAAFEIKEPEHTTVTVFTDKEEIGSEGNTGMASRALDHFVEDLCDIFGVKARNVYRNSICLSSDVNAAYDPTFADVFEKNNSSFLGHGPVLTKYTGARGKSGSNDASAETMGQVIACMEKENVIWQIGELGKVDEGGGGTIAKFMGDNDVDTVDLGVPVLAMHAPFEITSKLDIYHTYKAFCAFYR
ncbi:MAG: aminopeptidase [Lachnospiraceae bacterium]|nr:aminopeptidase [Lachnospiraceae bacterium]